MANRFRHVVLLLAASLLLVGISAATQVTLSESTTGQVVFTNVNGDQTDVTFGFNGNCSEGGNNCVAGYRPLRVPHWELQDVGHGRTADFDPSKCF